MNLKIYILNQHKLLSLIAPEDGEFTNRSFIYTQIVVSEIEVRNVVRIL